MIDPAGMSTAVIDSPERPEEAAAKQLEAFFLRQFLAEARPKSQMLGGGFAGDTFQDMLDGALADAMTEAGGLGLVDTFEAALSGDSPVAPRSSQLGFDAYGSGSIESPAASSSTPVGDLIAPAEGRWSSGFGLRTDPVTHEHSYHAGLDIAAPAGAPVVAAAAGRVTHAGPAGSYGNLVTVQHADGTETRYAHMSEVRVERGDPVAAGARLGDVGTTGKSTGPHLHFEVRANGKPQDPRPLLGRASGSR